MKPTTTQRIVYPNQLSAEEKERFGDELYGLHSRIFGGVSRSDFMVQVINSKADETVIQLQISEGGALVGFSAVLFFQRQLQGETVSILRFQAGMLSEYRGSNVDPLFFINQVFRYQCKHLGQKLYLLGTFVHPASYTILTRYADEVYPRPDRQTPEEIEALMLNLSTSFGYVPVDATNPFVVHASWQSRETNVDRRHETKQQIGKEAAFFLEQNPDFRKGQGLLVLAPISLGAVFRAGLKFVGRTLRKSVVALALPLRVRGLARHRALRS